MSKKISQLNPLLTPTKDDLLAVINEGETKNVTIGNMLSVSTRVSPNILKVSKSGDDVTGNGSNTSPFLTIKAAVAAAAAGGPTATNSYTIFVSPGEYAEVNPIDLPSYVNLEGSGSLGANRVSPTLPASPLFRPYPFSSIRGLTLYGVTGNAAILCSQAGLVLIDEILIRDSFYGIQTNMAGAIIDANHVMFATDVSSTESVIYNQGGKINIWNLTSYFINATSLFRVDGPTAQVNAWGVYTDSNVSLTNGVYATNSARFNGSDVAILADNIYRVNTGSFITGTAMTALNPSINDILQEDPNSVVTIQANVLHEDKFSITNWDNIMISYKSLEAGDQAQVFNEEVHVGSPSKGSETCMGEGDSTSRGMLAYTTLDGTTFTDISTEASSSSDSIFTMGTAAGSQMLLSWDLENDTDYLKFYGFKLKIATGGTAGTGDYVWEYWDGADWADLKVMITDGSAPYLQQGAGFFENAGGFQIRFDAYLAETGKWVKNDPILDALSSPRYWVRIRIIADMTTTPVMEQIKLHTSRFEVNEDGWTEYFGKARPQGTLAWDLGLLSPTTGGVPGDQNIYLSNTIGVGREKNLLVQNTTDRMGLVTNLPLDFDTSTPLKFQWYWTSDGIGGAVQWEVRWAYTKTGDDIYYASGGAPGTGVTQQNITLISAVTGAANLQRSEFVLLDFSSAISRRDDAPGDLIWITIERNGAAVGDTHPSDSALIHINPVYMKWSEGGHVL